MHQNYKLTAWSLYYAQKHSAILADVRYISAQAPTSDFERFYCVSGQYDEPIYSCKSCCKTQINKKNCASRNVEATTLSSLLTCNLGAAFCKQNHAPPRLERVPGNY